MINYIIGGIVFGLMILTIIGIIKKIREETGICGGCCSKCPSKCASNNK